MGIDIVESLKKLEVAVKGGGSIVSHPPLLSPDSKKLFIIQKNTLQVFNTESGQCTGKFSTPSASTIANIVYPDESSERILLLTSSGSLLEIDAENLTVLSTREVVLRPRNWIPIISVLNFIWPTGSNSDDCRPTHFFFVGYPQDSNLPSLYAVQNNNQVEEGSHMLIQFLCKDIVANLHSVAAGVNGRFVAGIQQESLFVKDMTSKGCKWHKAGTRKFTCIAVHPSEWVCATGDDSGRILIWNNVLDNHFPVAKTVCHWHTLPVADLCFSSDGSQMFSGGGECTLLKWDMNNTDNKRTLPRMGLPIRHVRGSLRNDMIAVSHADNSIQLVNPHNDIINQIQNITQCYIPENVKDINITDSSLGGQKVYQAGLHLDPTNNSLLTNGKPGHLQSYSFREDKHLYNLDITQQNFITAERNHPIPNSEVTHVAFSKNGNWLATGESRIDDTKCTELRLKFWKFNSERQKFLLNTSIEWPHEGGLNSLKIQPIFDSDPLLIAVTTGADKKFKTWGVVHDPSVHGKSEWWNCENISSYRNFSCGPLSFSHDGSIYAVGFERILTIWCSDTNELKSSLCHSKLLDTINLLEFASHISSHLVISCSASNIATWDVITSSLLWVAPFHAESLAVDPLSNLAVAFSSKHHVIFFSPDQPEPLAVHKNVSSSKVISSVFVPHGNSFEDLGLKSTVFFLNSSQEMCALLPPVEEVEVDDTLKIKPEASKSVLTPFAQLIAEKTVFESQKRKDTSTKHVGVAGYQILRDIMDQSPHTMPSLTYYCSKLLKALSIPRNRSDDLNEVSKAVEGSHRKFSKNIQTWNPSSEDEDMDVSELENLQLQLKKEQVVDEIKFIPDLNNVATEDTTWIDCIFN